MPRKRPGRVRAEQRLRRQHPGTRPVFAGLSSAATAEVVRIERSRTYLWPGATEAAALLWSRFVRSPGRNGWDQDDESHCDVWECCGSPFEARYFLEAVIRGMSRQRRSELRRIVDELDALSF